MATGLGQGCHLSVQVRLARVPKQRPCGVRFDQARRPKVIGTAARSNVDVRYWPDLGDHLGDLAMLYSLSLPLLAS